MSLKTDPNSRFFQTDTVMFGDEEVFGKWNPPEVVSRTLQDGEYTPYVVHKGQEGRPDLISDDVYGTTQLDWLLIAVNNARIALNWPRAGEVIKVPLGDLVLSELQ